MKACLEQARDLGAERFTIHPSQPQGFVSGGGPGTYLEDHWDLYADALSSAIRGIVADAGGVQVCVENESLTPFVEEILEGLLSEEGLFLALDAPKAGDPRKGAPLSRVEAFYLRNIDRVREVHLHDRRPEGRYHDILGYGGVDVGKYLRMFEPHEVHFTLEIRPREDAYRSLLYVERLWEDLF